MTDLDVILHLIDTVRLGVILHFDDIWDLSILGYLENIGMAGSQTWELTPTDTSLRGVKIYLFIYLFISVCLSVFLSFFLSFFLSLFFFYFVHSFFL